MATYLNEPYFSIRKSGNGYELLNDQGEVVAWTLDRNWAIRIVLGLTILNDIPSQKK